MTRTAATIVMAICGLAPLAAQTRPGRLLITVVDPSGGVIPGANVTVSGAEDATRKTPPPPVKTSDQGIAIINDLTLGRYIVTAEFGGFAPGVLNNTRVRTGDNKHIIVLPLAQLTDTVTVGRDAQEAGSDRQSRFGSALTREQIDALSDDPAEMQRQLQEMAGDGAVLRIDSFEGGNLPPKSQIKAIHITRDAFAAENHNAGGLFVDIITQPGSGPLRGNTNMRFRGGALSGQSPFTEAKGPEQTRNVGGNIGGTLIRQRSSFSVFINSQGGYETPNINVALPDGTMKSEIMPAKQGRDTLNANALFDYAITRDQTLRVQYGLNDNSQKNLGIGGYDQIARAYSSQDRFQNVRIQEAGPLGRRFFTNTRLQLNVSNSDSRSTLELPTIRVNDAFTSGGGQVAGGRHQRTMNLASDLDYVRGMHSMRAGIVLNSIWQRSDDTTNYLGTYTFESLDAYNAGIARTYTRRIGDPLIEYRHLDAALYVQDDIRVKKGLTLSPGLRYEAQTHVSDYTAFGPRLGATWAPFTNGKTTFRVSWGIFYDWLPASTYEQTLRVDGSRQQELNVVDPPFPAVEIIGTAPATNRYLLDEELQLGRTMRVSAGVERAITPRFRVSAIYANARGGQLPRGDNLNLPVDGVRPDPRFANVVNVVSDAESRTQSLNLGGSLNLAPFTPMGATTGPLFNWKRVNLNGNLQIGDTTNNTDGAFRFPASGNIGDDWGPTGNDVRYRGGLSANMSMLRNLSANVFISASTGTPYTIRTGGDDNGDLEFNDRPPGEGRNTARTAGQMNVSAFFSYVIPFGGRTVALPPGIMINGGGVGGVRVETVSMDNIKRYRLQLNLQIQNLTNHHNYVGYSGIMTSPFFRQPTSVAGTRKVDIGVGFSF